MNKKFAFAILLLAASAVAQSKDQPQFLNPPALSTPKGYTHVVVVPGSKLIFLSGQVALNTKGEMVGGNDFRAQATQTFENIKAALDAAGAKPSQIVKINFYVVGLTREKIVTLREVRDKYLDTTHPPASTLVGVQGLFREDAQLEVEVVAQIP